MAIEPDEWDFICFADQFWRENSAFPSDREIEEGTGFNATKTAIMLASELVQKHLNARGIDPDQTKNPQQSSAGRKRKGPAGRLSDLQLAAVSSVLNPADSRSLERKLEVLGISPTTYNGWKNNPVFLKFLTSQGEMLFGENMPEVHNALTTRAVRGDIRATKLLYEVTGFYRPNQQDVQSDTKMMVIRLIEILQKHVKDPVILQAIAEDIQMVQSSIQAASSSPSSLENRSEGLGSFGGDSSGLSGGSAVLVSSSLTGENSGS